jgi:hypothetical protein
MIARAPAAESTASTQKGIASMHSSRLLSGAKRSLPTVSTLVTTL